MYEIVVSPEDNNKRIDNVVTKNIANTRPELAISRAVIQRLVGSGDISLNKEDVKSSHKVKTDDLIEVDEERLGEEMLLEKESKTPRAEDLPLNIIYEDDDIIVVNKPAGMVVHPACGNYSGTLVNALLNYKGFLTDFNKPKETEIGRAHV